MKNNIKNTAKIFLGLLIIMVLIVIYYANFHHRGDTIVLSKQPDPRTMSYIVGNDTFMLKNGKAEIETTQEQVSKSTLSLFGEPVYGDLDNDGDIDAAILLVNTVGESEVLYYAVLAINNGTSAQATNVMYLGDRIAPQTVEIHEGRALYNFSERKGNGSSTSQPSIGRSVWVHYDAKNNEIGEWVKGFEGESALPTIK